MDTAALLQWLPGASDLSAVARRYSESYSAAHPFPHAVLDNLFSEPLLDRVLEEFPKPSDKHVSWKRFDNAFEKKLASSGGERGPYTDSLLRCMNSQVFLDFLEKLTGISGLIADPHFLGGGLHQIVPGGYLKIHVDFNKHATMKLDRRLNVLLYLNRDWKDGYKGHLELWDAKMQYCQKKIAPIFNRTVVFSTTDFSYHGHPEPLLSPPGVTRKSLALYYYSAGRPLHEVNPLLRSHGTLFRLRPGEKVSLRSFRDVVMRICQSVSQKLNSKLGPSG